MHECDSPGPSCTRTALTDPVQSPALYVPTAIQAKTADNHPLIPGHTAYIGFGSNLGDRRAMIQSALQGLARSAGILAVNSSSLYETQPVGGPAGQNLYLNGVAMIRTTHSPVELLACLLALEAELGRVRRERWGARLIDLDLLIYDELLLDTHDLTLPHPRLHERRFVLEPLSELAPDLKHPRLQVTMRDLLARLDAG